MFGPTQTIHDIHNVPRYALNHRFWVYREVDGKRWFFGAWDEANKAIDVATTERGWVFDTQTAEGKGE